MLLFIIKNWKYVVIALGSILIIGLYFKVGLLMDKLAQAKSDNQSLTQLYSDAHRDLTHYKTANGQIVTQNEALQLSQKAMKDLMESQEHFWLESFNVLKKSLKNLQVAQQISAEAVDSLKVLLQQEPGWYVNAKGDTVKINFVKFNYKDEYATIKARQVSLDSAVVTYNIKVPLQQAIYWDRKWFLGKKHYKSEITSPNESIAITKLETIFVKKKKN